MYRRFPLRELQTVSNSSDRHKQIVSSVPVPRNLYSPQYLWLRQANRMVGSSPHKVGPADLEYVQNLTLLSQLRNGDLLHLGPDLATERVENMLDTKYKCKLEQVWTPDGLGARISRPGRRTMLGIFQYMMM